jgi:hypothetical protein
LAIIRKYYSECKIDAAKLPVNEIFKRSGKSLIRQREFDQPGPLPIIHLEVTAV